MKFEEICSTTSDLASESFEERYHLQYDVASPSLNEIKEMHFMAYKNLRFKWKMATKKQINLDDISPLKKAYIVVERSCNSSGLDWDNVYGGLKPIFDCLVVASKRNPDGLGLIEDDKISNMPYPPIVIQKKVKKGYNSLSIRIFEII